MTVSEPIALLSPCSLLSSALTPWVNEAGFTPSHPRAVPSQCASPGNQGSRHFHHKDREGSSPGERAWGPHVQSSFSPRGPRAKRKKPSAGVESQPASSCLPTQDSPPDVALYRPTAASCPAISWGCLMDRLSHLNAEVTSTTVCTIIPGAGDVV